MRYDERPPTAQLRPSLWAGRVALGRFVLTLSVNRERPRDKEEEGIGNRLASLRRERGLSRTALAERLQIHPTTLNAIENGTYVPSLRLALRVSEVFDLPIETIFFSPSREHLA